MKKHTTYFLSFFIILLISLFTLSPTFNLALFGDDWYTFWRYLYILDHSTSEYNNLSYFITPYGSQDVVMGLLKNIYGFKSTLYYITSYILRVIASISLLPLVLYLTKSRLAAFFASIFFSVTTIGFDTTNWVFNMPVYLSITFFNLFLLFLLISREEGRTKLFIIALLFFYLAHITSPIRMTGLLAFTLLIELYWLLQNPSLKIVKVVVLQLLMFFLVFLFISHTGKFPGNSESLSNHVTGILGDGFMRIWQLLSQGRSDFLFYPVLIVGKMIIPDMIAPTSVYTPSISGLFLLMLFPLFFIFFAISFFLSKSTKELKGKFFKAEIASGFIATLLVGYIYHSNKLTLTISNVILLQIGFYLLIAGVFLFFSSLRRSPISTSLFISIAWLILSFIFTWFRAPETVLPTVHRYLIVSAVGIALFLANLISLGRNLKYQMLIFYIMAGVLTLHIIATQKYEGQLLIYHGKEVSSKIWSTIPYIPQAKTATQPLVFYLENDGNNSAILHTSLGFGLDYRIALLYNIWDRDKIPVVMDNWQNVISAVTDGKAFAPYEGRPQKPVALDHVYAFRLEGRDHLINITESARKKLVTGQE